MSALREQAGTMYKIDFVTFEYASNELGFSTVIGCLPKKKYHCF